MKKFFALAAIVALVSFTACNGDDDNDEPEMNCRTCGLDFEGTVINTEYCDNGDGTITFTTQGQSQTEDLNGVTFEEFIAGLELLGSTCN